jgi:hypothetical protein
MNLTVNSQPLAPYDKEANQANDWDAFFAFF